jgi:hypothetical protein
MRIKDGKHCRLLVSVIKGSKVVKEVWCSNTMEVEIVKERLGGGYSIEIQDLTWTDTVTGFSAYQKARQAAETQGCDYFCVDLLYGSHGIVEMSKHTGDSFYEIRRSISRGWRSSNGHQYEKLNGFREED